MADVRKAPYDAVAKEAFDYVRDKMRVGAANRYFDQPAHYLPDLPFSSAMAPNVYNRLGCVSAMREITSAIVNPMWDRVNQVPESIYATVKMEAHGKTIDIYAAKAEEFGCGNCHEQSALTFQYLRNRGVRPLDWIMQAALYTVPVLGARGDHVFVIIGRDGTKDVGDVTKWNPEVFWCDPYENEMGGLDRIRERFKGKSLSLMHRLD